VLEGEELLIGSFVVRLLCGSLILSTFLVDRNEGMKESKSENCTFYFGDLLFI